VVKAKDTIKRASYSVRLDPDLVQELKHVAVDERRPISTLIEEGIRLILNRYKKQPE